MGFEPTTVGLEVRRSIQTELRALDYDDSSRPKSGCGSPHRAKTAHPSKRYSDVTYGNRLNIQYATGRPTIVTAKKAATFAQSQLNHQPTSTKYTARTRSECWPRAASGCERERGSFRLKTVGTRFVSLMPSGRRTTVAVRNHAALTTSGVAHQPTKTNHSARTTRERSLIRERRRCRAKSVLAAGENSRPKSAVRVSGVE